MIDSDITSRAILLHQNKTTKSVEITTHEIIKLDTTPNQGGPGYTLGAGQVFGAEQKAEFAAILNDERAGNDLSLLPESLLAKTAYAVVWWMPGKVRQLVVSTRDGAQRFDIKMPGTVAAMCRGHLYVAAFKGSQRPTAETPLYRMPIPNMTSDFNFCMGNIQLPKDANIQHIPTWESGIWDSRNTHLGREPLKGIKSGEAYVKLLADLDGKGRFPTNKLIPTDRTLGDLLHALETRG